MRFQNGAPGARRGEPPRPPGGAQNAVESVQREGRNGLACRDRFDESPDVGAQSTGFVEQGSGLGDRDAPHQVASPPHVSMPVEPHQEIAGRRQEVLDAVPGPSHGVEEVEREAPEFDGYVKVPLHSNRITYVLQLLVKDNRKMI